jgi:protoporphyrinogen oxidase
VFEGQGLWVDPNDKLIELGASEVERLGLARKQDVSDGTVVRLKKAYPVYDGKFQQALAKLRAFLTRMPGLLQVGRNGQHRYNNQDHSMLTALLAARNVIGEQHDIWDVNADQDYHETMERQVPRRLGEREPAKVGSGASP